MSESKGFGLARMKQEGMLQDWETGEEITDPVRIAAYKAVRKREHEALSDFRRAVASVPETLTPAWLAAQYTLAETAHWREAITYLRRLVLWRVAGFAQNDVQ